MMYQEIINRYIKLFKPRNYLNNSQKYPKSTNIIISAISKLLIDFNFCLIKFLKLLPNGIK